VKVIRLATVLAVLVPTMASAQVVRLMTPEKVRAAIKEGREDGEPDGYMLSPVEPFVVVATPYWRVQNAAADAKRRYVMLTPRDIPAELLKPTVEVSAEPYFLGGEETISTPVVSIEHIVAVTRDAAGVEHFVQPTSIEKTTRTWSNPLGVTKEGTAISATFPLRLLVAGTEFRVVTSDREARFPITDETVSAIR